jgi:hypothetical protein
MFKKPYEERLRHWRDLRNSLEVSEDPVQKVLDFYKNVVKVSINVDPYTKELWPNPWELLYDNTYCEFCVLLGIYYTLKLTDRFSHSHFEIHITQDKQQSQSRYLLMMDGTLIEHNRIIPESSLSASLEIEKRYVLPALH